METPFWKLLTILVDCQIVIYNKFITSRALQRRRGHLMNIPAWWFFPGSHSDWRFPSNVELIIAFPRRLIPNVYWHDLRKLWNNTTDFSSDVLSGGAGWTGSRSLAPSHTPFVRPKWSCVTPRPNRSRCSLPPAPTRYAAAVGAISTPLFMSPSYFIVLLGQWAQVGAKAGNFFQQIKINFATVTEGSFALCGVVFFSNGSIEVLKNFGLLMLLVGVFFFSTLNAYVFCERNLI